MEFDDYSVSGEFPGLPSRHQLIVKESHQPAGKLTRADSAEAASLRQICPRQLWQFAVRWFAGVESLVFYRSQTYCAEHGPTAASAGRLNFSQTHLDIASQVAA